MPKTALAALTVVVLALPPALRAQSVERPEVLPEDCEVQLALSAAPAHLRDGASVWAMREDGYDLVRDGTNGFACIVNRDGPHAIKPTCFDPEGARTIVPKIRMVGKLLLAGTPADEIQRQVDAAFASGELESPQRAGVAYMLSTHNHPWAAKRQALGIFPPHVMFYAPNVTNEDIGTTREALMKNRSLPFVFYNGPDAFIILVTDDIPPGTGDFSSCPDWLRNVKLPGK